MNSYTAVYSFKVWITSVILTPLLILAIYLVTSISEQFGKMDEFFHTAIWIYTVIVIVGALLSVFSWSVFYFAVAFILYLPIKSQVMRWLIFISGILLTIITFFIVISLMSNSINLQQLFDLLGFRDTTLSIIMYCYSLIIGGGTWFYKLDVGYLFPKNFNETTPV